MTKVVFVVLLNPFSEGGGAGGGLRRKEDNQRGEQPGVMEVGSRGKARESKKTEKRRGAFQGTSAKPHFFIAIEIFMVEVIML